MRKSPLQKGKYLFFWGEFLSNWEYSPMKIGGVLYNCVEQYMMAEKARAFGDDEVLAKILASDSPKGQKEFGRKVRGYDDARWTEIRYQVVLTATLEKYRQNKHLREMLLATDDAFEFVEASPEDVVWGIGMGKTAAGIEDSSNWKGQNLLGKAITEARAIIRAEAST